MKFHYGMMSLVAASLMLASCESMGSLNSVASNQANVAAQVIPATVVSATQTTIDTSSTGRNLGTGIGAALGAGSGALLGRGKGQLVSAVGFGALGALAGRYAVDATGNTTAQRLVVKVDGSKTQYTVTQPVYKEIGLIPVGTHGTLELGNGTSKFLPDGM